MLIDQRIEQHNVGDWQDLLAVVCVVYGVVCVVTTSAIDEDVDVSNSVLICGVVVAGITDVFANSTAKIS